MASTRQNTPSHRAPDRILSSIKIAATKFRRTLTLKANRFVWQNQIASVGQAQLGHRPRDRLSRTVS